MCCFFLTHGVVVILVCILIADFILLMQSCCARLVKSVLSWQGGLGGQADMNVAGTGLRQQHQQGGHPAGSWPNDQQIQQSAQQDPSDRLHRYVQCSKAVWQFSGTSYTAYLKSILFFSHPRSEGWQQHGHSFSVYLCSLSFRSIFFTGSPVLLSMSWCSLYMHLSIRNVEIVFLTFYYGIKIIDYFWACVNINEHLLGNVHLLLIVSSKIQTMEFSVTFGKLVMWIGKIEERHLKMRHDFWKRKCAWWKQTIIEFSKLV